MDSQLNSAQLQALAKELKDQLARSIEAMQLRKWSFEKALESAKITQQGDLIKYAETIYSFVSKPASEINVRIT